MPSDAPALRLPDTLRALRRAGDLPGAQALLRERGEQRPNDRALAQLAWEHEAFWWQPLQGRRLVLRRRGPDDAAFVRACWADRPFMARFNRMAPPLPDSDEDLKRTLANEQSAILSESRALHWTVHREGRRLGFVSLVNASLAHRRGEFLIGVREASAWDGPEAAHLALRFFWSQARVERLTAYFYPENAPAIRAAEKLGFQVEGRLRRYLRSSDGSRHDLVVAGLCLDDSFMARAARLQGRLVGAPSLGSA